MNTFIILVLCLLVIWIWKQWFLSVKHDLIFLREKFTLAFEQIILKWNPSCCSNCGKASSLSNSSVFCYGHWVIFSKFRFILRVLYKLCLKALLPQQVQDKRLLHAVRRRLEILLTLRLKDWFLTKFRLAPFKNGIWVPRDILLRKLLGIIAVGAGNKGWIQFG